MAEDQEPDQANPAGGNPQNPPFPGMGTPIPSAPEVKMPAVDTNHRNFDSGGQATAIAPPPPEQPVAQQKQPDTQPQQPDTPDHELWEGLNRSQLYSKGYDEFKKKYNNTDAIDKLYQGLSENQLYSKSKEDFYGKYFSHLPSKEVSDAHDFLNNYLSSPKANAAIDKITGDAFYNNIYDQQRQNSQGKDATRIQQPLPIRLPGQAQQDRQDYTNQSKQDPTLLKNVLNEAKKQNPDDAPAINHAAFVAHANTIPHSDAVVKYYGDQMKSGKLDFDVNTNQIVKPVSGIDAFFNGMKKHSDDQDAYKFYSTHNDDDVIKKLNDKGPDDPFKPVMKAKGGWGSFLEGQGANAAPLVKFGLPAALLNPFGATAAAVGAAMGAYSGSEDLAHSAYKNTLEQSYHEYMSAHPDANSQDALAKAKDDANAASLLAAGQGIALSAGGALGKEAEFAPVRYSKKNLNALMDIGSNLKTLAKHAVPEISTQAGIAAAVKGLNNAQQGKVTSSGVIDEAGSMALFTAGMIGLKVPGAFKGGGLSDAGKANLMDLYAKSPEPMVDAGLANAVKHEAMTPQEAGELKVEINAHKKTTEGKADLTAPVTPEGEDLIDKYENGQLPKYATEAIKKVAKANGVEFSEEEKDPSVEDIYNKLKHRQSAGKVDNFVSDADHENNLTSGLTGINKEMYEKDPEGFLKMVADQAHSGDATRTELESGAGITKSLIDHATSKYPEHIISSPKIESNEEANQASPEASAWGERPLENKEGEGSNVASSSSIPIKPNVKLRTLDYGDWKGKPESKEAQEQIKQEILSNEPIGKTGERFQDFTSRMLPEMKELINNPEHNGTVVTHSSVIKALKVWEEMGRPDKLEGEKLKEFAQKYVDLKPEKEGHVNTFVGDNGTETHVIRHGETEDNKLSEFRHDDTQLTDKGIAQATAAGKELYGKTRGKVPSIHSSDLPRTIHTSDIVDKELNNGQSHHTVSWADAKPKENATAIRSDQGQGGEPGTRSEGSEDEGRKNIQLDEEKVQQKLAEPDKQATGQTDNAGVGEERTVGVRHESLRKIADRLGLEQPEKGTILSAQEQTERGRALLKAGADPMKVQEDFDNTGKVDADSISVARAHYENLVKDVQAAFDTKGKGSPEYEAAKKIADDWQREVMKPMGTASGGAFTALQGETDVDTGSFISMARAFEDKYGKAPNAEQEAKLKEASDKVKELSTKVSDLEQKLTEAIDKNVGTPKEKAVYANKAKAVADAFRKLKTKPFTFKDENGNEINVTKMGVDWNDIVEAGAKIIEKTGEIADGIAAAIEKIKDADWYKGLSDSDKDRFAKQLEAHYNEEAPELAYTDLADRLAGKKDNKFSPEEAKGIWGYMKDEYLRKGKDFDTSVNGTAVDLGISSEQVRKAITSPKSARVISDEMYIEQYKEQQAIRDAKVILKTANLSKLERTKVAKFAKSLPNVFFALKTFGHGTVGNVTHSGMNIFTPSAWKTYWPNFAKQFKYAFGGTTKEGLAAYQQEMNDLIHHPRFAFWKRMELAVDPAKSYDDYQQFNKHLKALTEMGDRGFNALKVQRLQLAEHLYNGLSEAAKADPNTGKEIAKIVNHSTGTANVPVPKAIGTLVFAPRLEASRWARIGEVGKAAKTLYNWSEATESDKAAAKIIIRRNAEIMSTYLAALASNSAILAIAGSKQKINYTDPTQSDWLKFKGKDQTLDMTGGMLSSLRFLSGLIHASVGDKKKVRGREEARSETIFKSTGKYIRGKLSPFGATALDVASQSDYSGRPLPFSSDKGDAFHPKYTWKEYLEEQQLPIPVSEAFKVTHDQMRDRGVPEATASEILHGVISGAISGSTGARVAIDYANDKKEASDKKAEANKKPTLPPTQYHN